MDKLCQVSSTKFLLFIRKYREIATPSTAENMGRHFIWLKGRKKYMRKMKAVV